MAEFGRIEDLQDVLVLRAGRAGLDRHILNRL
jgi:hypothetical protein